MSLMSPRSFRSITGCTIWVAAACAALTIVLATTRAHAQDKPFSAEELSQAKTYIATKMDPAVRANV